MGVSERSYFYLHRNTEFQLIKFIHNSHLWDVGVGLCSDDIVKLCGHQGAFFFICLSGQTGQFPVLSRRHPYS